MQAETRRGMEHNTDADVKNNSYNIIIAEAV